MLPGNAFDCEWLALQTTSGHTALASAACAHLMRVCSCSFPIMATCRTCPCGSGVVYRECCQPIHTKQTTAQSAETQLKARFRWEGLAITDRCMPWVYSVDGALFSLLGFRSRPRVQA